MKRDTASGRGARGLLWWVFSVPIFFKIMGIGLLVATIFGAVTLFQISRSMSRVLYQTLEERARFTAHSLAATLERPMSTGDMFSVEEKLRRTRRICPDLRYILVRNPAGAVLSHTFEKGVPPDLLALWRPGDGGDSTFQVLATREGLVLDVSCPILGGHAGFLELGLTDRAVTQELGAIIRSVWWSLMLCATVGAGLAWLLTHLLTHPIDHLVEAANRVGKGLFETRAEVFSADEVGTLAAAFNQMAESLQRYRHAVEEKERARLLLLEKIVHAQEEERRTISRELHDELGQSLSALLLAVQSLGQDGEAQPRLRQELEGTIRRMIEEVRRLAWGMRPSVLDDYGLDSALARHVEEVSQRFNLPVDYQYSRPKDVGRLPLRVEASLFRIAQEALTNVVRHARASRASVVVLQRPDQVTLLVEDDGCGFDARAMQKQGICLGLTGMQERAVLLGGTCTVESAAGQGTTVRVCIPLGEAQPCLSAS